jgi:hypothetical protein
MGDREIRERALERARLVLASLEEQAAGYTALSVPVNLVIELNEKREEVKRLEALLSGRDTEAFPNTLPRRDAFFGREKEIASALDALSPQDRGWGVVVDGIGGIGKTALAIEVAYICSERNLFDVFLFTTAKQRQLETSGEQAVLGATLTLEGMVSKLSSMLGQPTVTQLTGAEQSTNLLNVLQNFSGPGRRVLLILDNLETFTSNEQALVATFLRYLPQYCKAVVTSRRRVGDGAVWLRLEKLEWEAARQLIEEEMRRAPNLNVALTQADVQQWKELYNETGGSPLALQWMLGLMRMRNLSLKRAVEVLRSKDAADSPLHQFIYREARQAMSADDWWVLGALSLFDKPAAFEPLIRTTNYTRLALESILERLHAFSLVNVLGPGGPYSLHPLTRSLARDEMHGQLEMAQTLQARFTHAFGLRPPAPTISLFGRSPDLVNIKSLLCTSGESSTKEQAIIIRGWPGVGKTSLVSALAHDPDIAENFPDGVLWTSLGRQPELLQTIEQWGRVLGLDDLLPVQDLEEAVQQLGASLRDSRMLLIVDDVWSGVHGLPFLKVCGPNSKVLMTTRLLIVAEELVFSERAIYNLPPLNEEAALLLLNQLAPSVVNEYPTECLQLVRELGSLPLALQIAGRMLRAEAKMGLSVINLLENLRKDSALFSESAPIDRAEGTILPTVTALLRSSTDMLDEETRKRFAYLGAFAPAPATYGLDALRAIWQDENPLGTVRKLVGYGLLEPLGNGRFQMNALLVRHARSLLT